MGAGRGSVDDFACGRQFAFVTTELGKSNSCPTTGQRKKAADAKSKKEKRVASEMTSASAESGGNESDGGDADDGDSQNASPKRTKFTTAEPDEADPDAE
jgi:hypothetical protein